MSYNIGLFKVHAKHNKIQFEQEEYKIEPKIMEVLCFLIKHQGQVVSREQIIENLWPNQIVSDEVVTRAIFELRKIFKDSAKNPKFIETIARKGYSFIHHVESETGLVDKTFKSESKNRNIRAFSVIAIIAFSFALLFIFVTSENNSAKIPRGKMSLITQDEHKLTFPSLSPQGKSIAYVRIEKDIYQLVLTNSKTHKSKVVYESTGRIVSPNWMDTKEILFVDCIENGCALKIYNALDNNVTEEISLKARVVALAYNSRTNSVALEYFYEGEREVGLLNLNQKTRLVSINTKTTNQTTPEFGTNGKYLYYSSRVESQVRKIFKYDLKSKQEKSLNIKFNNVFSIASKSESELWVVGRRDGETSTWLLDTGVLNQKKVFPLSPGEYPVELGSGSVDTKKLVLRGLSRNVKVNSLGTLPEQAATINSEFIDLNAVYSVKNQRFYFASNRSGQYEVWTGKNGVVEMLTTDTKTNLISTPIMVGNDTHLAFLSPSINGAKLTLLRLEDNSVEKELVLPQNSFLLSSSDELNVIFFSVRENDTYNIYSLSLDNLEYEKAILNAGLIADYNKEEDSLTFINMQTNSIMKKLASGEIKELHSLPSSQRFRPQQLNLTNNILYFIEQNGEESELKMLDMESGAISSKLPLPTNSYVTQIGEYKEEPFVIYDQIKSDQSRIYLVEY